MKGIVFTEFLEMVEAQYSPAFLEDLIDEVQLSSGGTYTSVGTYPHRELVSLLMRLSARTKIEIPSLMRSYGEFLFDRFKFHYPQFFKPGLSSFDFLRSVEHHIHQEVKKLYADAKLPSFKIEVNNSKHFSMVYKFERPFGDLCEGLIIGCLRYFGDAAGLQRENLQTEPVTRVRFKIFKARA